MIYSNKELIEYVDNFIQKTGMSDTAFGIKALKDPSFVTRLRAGRGCGEEVQKRITDFIEGYNEEVH